MHRIVPSRDLPSLGEAKIPSATKLKESQQDAAHLCDDLHLLEHLGEAHPDGKEGGEAGEVEGGERCVLEGV